MDFRFYDKWKIAQCLKYNFMAGFHEITALAQQELVTDKMAAESALGRINYYRFSGYCLPFEITRHKFISDVSFERILALYKYDRKLRSLAVTAIERIEVATIDGSPPLLVDSE